jgi:hypothetical protein
MFEATRGVFPCVTSVAALLLLLGAPVSAQEAPPETPSLADLRRLVDEQKAALERHEALLEEQKRLIEDQGRELAVLRKKLDETGALALASHNQLAELQEKPPQPSVSAAVEARLAQVEHEVQRLPELEKTTLSAAEFPGAFRIPGTDAALRIGGLVRLTAIRTFDALGTDDRFITSSIPIAGTEAAGKGARMTSSARPSRFNLDLRTPTGVGAMRAFIEGDYAGSGSSFRLRHAYGQWRKFTMGQTWSTFADPEAEPDGIDFEGLNAISLFRQAQVRWTHPFGERLSLAIAGENPAPDISAADGSPVQGVNQVPDAVVRLRWSPGEKTLVRAGQGGTLLRGGGHVQLAFLVRQIRGEYEPNATLSTQGTGYHLSGRLRSPWHGDRDRILFATAGGWGIGRYITDLGSLGGQDAVYDPASNTLEALPVASAYVGYEHWWSPTLRSTTTWGSVFVDNLGIQVGDSLHRTDRATLNLSWSPIPRIDVVGELLWGRRIDKDGQRGEATQMQLGTNFRF